jgi:hypothetical protein
MEAFLNLISLILFVAIVASPGLVIYVLQRRKTTNLFLIYSIVELLIMLHLVFLMAWWDSTSNELLIKHLGYNWYGANDVERFASVAQKDVKKVNELLAAIFGIGWPLKFWYALGVYVPYMFAVYFVNFVAGKIRVKYFKNSF